MENIGLRNRAYTAAERMNLAAKENMDNWFSEHKDVFYNAFVSAFEEQPDCISNGGGYTALITADGLRFHGYLEMGEVFFDLDCPLCGEMHDVTYGLNILGEALQGRYCAGNRPVIPPRASLCPLRNAEPCLGKECALWSITRSCCSLLYKEG